MNRITLVLSIVALATSGIALNRSGRHSGPGGPVPTYKLDTPEAVVRQFFELVYTEGSFSRFMAGGEFASKHRKEILKTLKIERVEKKADFAIVFFQVEADGTTYQKALWERKLKDNWLFMRNQYPQHSDEVREGAHAEWFEEMASEARDWEKAEAFPWWL